MSCEQLRPLLYDHAAGTLAAPWRGRLRRHLEGCATCRSELAASEQLWRAVGDLPRERRPQRDLWPGIAGRLETLARPRTSAGWWRAAAAMVVVAGGLALAASLRPVPPAPAPAAVAAAPAAAAPGAGELRRRDGVLHAYLDLVETVERRRRLEPTGAAALATGLAELELAVAEIEAALVEHPGNRRLEMALAAAYRRESAWAARLART